MSRESSQFRSGGEAAEFGRLGGKASGRSRRKKKELREILSTLLNTVDIETNLTYGEKACIALIQKAVEGDVKAFSVLRDTTDGKPIERAKVEINSKPMQRELTPEEVCDQLIAQHEKEGNRLNMYMSIKAKNR